MRVSAFDGMIMLKHRAWITLITLDALDALDTLDALIPLVTLITLDALDALIPLIALRSLITLSASFTLGTGRPCCAVSASCTNRTDGAYRTLRTGRSSCAVSAISTSRTDGAYRTLWTGRSCFTCVTLFTLQALRTGRSSCAVSAISTSRTNGTSGTDGTLETLNTSIAFVTLIAFGSLRALCTGSASCASYSGWNKDCEVAVFLGRFVPECLYFDQYTISLFQEFIGEDFKVLCLRLFKQPVGYANVTLGRCNEVNLGAGGQDGEQADHHGGGQQCNEDASFEFLRQCHTFLLY